MFMVSPVPLPGYRSNNYERPALEVTCMCVLADAKCRSVERGGPYGATFDRMGHPSGAEELST